MSDQCHECVWIINKLNQEYDELYNSYKKKKQENDEYKKILKNADKLTPLSAEQIAKAKTFVYIYSILTRVYSPLIPVKEVKDKAYKDINFWKNLEKLIENYKSETDDFYKNFKIQLEKSDRHTINYNFLK